MAFESSDTNLVQSFEWAKKQAMAYVQLGGDPVGLWYETGLPGRTRFSMRDTSHQSMGAQALGLAPYTHNMLLHFAENVSDSKDWCSYWGIDRWGRPASVDYKNDAEFWYDLPANFDVLDACYRMFLWTGDLTYVNDPVFLNFYDRTVSDYVKRWSLGPDDVMTRKRWVNMRKEFDPHESFLTARGIPGYQESPRDYVVGIDLLASEYDAFLAYAYIQEYRGNVDAGQTYRKKAAEVRALINSAWWDEKSGQFYKILDKDYHLQPSASPLDDVNVELLYRGAADDGPKLESALNALLDSIKQNPSGKAEGESHYPEVLYRYGVPDVAYAEIMDLTSPGKYRQEYPEVSYSVVGAIVTGLMGINLEAASPLESSVNSNYSEIVVKTLPALTKQTDWAELRNLPIRTNVVSVRHDGVRKTTFTNQVGPSLFWQAMFPGSYDTLIVDGKPVKSHPDKETLGRVTSWVRLPVGAGDTVTVEIPSAGENH
ncbi:MAG: hypothetical protein ACLP1Y_05290 [Candidatus Acidiferrales bacterium]